MVRSQAAERPVYTAVNLRKIGLGIPMFGQISLVLAPRVVKPMAVIAPCDTGWYETCCNITWQRRFCSTYSADAAGCNLTQRGSAMPGGCVVPATGSGCVPANMTAGQAPTLNGSGVGPSFNSFGAPVDCSAWDEWDKAPGTYSDFRHIVLTGANFWGRRRGEHGVSEYLARLLGRMFGDWSNGSSLLPIEGADEFGYWEAEAIGMLRFPESVKLVLGSFSALFGTAVGAQLREWCATHGWVLAWSDDPR